MSDCLIFKEKKALFHLKQGLMCYLKILFSENMGGVKNGSIDLTMVKYFILSVMVSFNCPNSILRMTKAIYEPVLEELVLIANY